MPVPPAPGAARTPTDAEPATGRWRLRVLVLCGMSLFMIYVDTTALNVALPTIHRDLGATVTDLQWVTDAYLLVLASLLMVSGSIGDRIGRRRVFVTGLLLFTAGSALCSGAPDVGALIAFRATQALGGCMLVPASLSILRQVFTDPAERARALGVWSGLFGLGVAAGPIIGGALVSAAGWRSVFWVNIPVGLVTWFLARRFIPESRAERPRALDPPGQVLMVVVLATTTYGLIAGPSSGWGTPLIVGSFCAAGLGLAALLAVERRRPEPLLEVHFFRSPPFAAATAVATTTFLAFAGFLFVTSLYLQDVRGDSAIGAGVALLPATGAIALCAPLSGRIVGRFGPRAPMALSGVLVMAGGALLLDLGPHTGLLRLAAAYVVIGCGFGLVNPPVTSTAVSGMPPDRAGVASAITAASRQVGNVLGVAVMGSMVSVTALGSRRLTGTAAARFTADSHLSWAVVVACGAVSALTAAACTGRWGVRVADRVYRDEPYPVADAPALGAGSRPTD